MTPVFFLDLDDVLVLDARYTSYQVRECFRRDDLDWPELWDGLIDAAARANLRTLHDEFAPTYVISSSWGTFLTREQVVDVLRRTGLDFVADCLHHAWDTPKSAGHSRAEEILGWLSCVFPGRSAASLPLLVLDDTESGDTLVGSTLDQAGQVVLCDVWRGLTSEKLSKARQLMRVQLSRDGYTR